MFFVVSAVFLFLVELPLFCVLRICDRIAYRFQKARQLAGQRVGLDKLEVQWRAVSKQWPVAFFVSFILFQAPVTNIIGGNATIMQASIG
jgi:hypothetical protein